MAVFQADSYRCLALLVSSYQTRGFRHIASSFFAGKPRSNVDRRSLLRARST